MNLWSQLRGSARSNVEDFMVQQMKLDRQFGGYGSPQGDRVEIANNFQGYITAVHKQSAPIAAAVTARAHLISQLRFTWRSSLAKDNGRLFGNASLAPLEGPSRSRMLHLAEIYASYGGTAFFAKWGGGIRVLQPDWVKIVLGSDLSPEDPMWQIDAEPIGYLYCPGGRLEKMTVLMADEVSRWMPEPDPLCPWRGESWVTSVLTEVGLDAAASLHTEKFYVNGTTPQVVFSLDPSINPEQAQVYAEMINKSHAGASNAYRNLVIGGGASATVVGSQLKELDQAGTQGLFENRVSTRSRVPAVVLGIREGLDGSALNSGNYGQTRRLWSDEWFSPTADGLCAALEALIGRPDGDPSELTYDRSRVEFFQEDRKDEADIRAQDGLTLKSLLDAGFKADAAVEAVTTGDFNRLANQHTGLPTVQVQGSAPTPPGGTP